MLTFDPEKGFSVTPTSELRAAIASDWRAVFDDGSATLNTESESPAGQLIDSQAVLVTAKDSEILRVANQFDPRVAEGVFQDAIAAIYFLTRKTAQPTVVTCTCTGLYNTVIPAGSVIQNTEGYRLTSVGSAIIGNDGKAEVEFSCVEPGPIAIGAGTCTKIVTVIPGWDTVTNDTAGTPGSLIETRQALEKRRRLSVAANAHGSRLALQGALLSTDGVVDCVVLENKSDDPTVKEGVPLIGHSVGICIYGGADADIAKTIYEKLDAGCGTNGETEVTYVSEDSVINTYGILRPAATDVYVTVEINQTLDTQSTVIEDIRDAVYADFYGNDENSGNVRVGMAQTVYASRFSVAIIKTARVTDLVSVSIGWSADTLETSITVDATKEPVLDRVNINVIVNSME